MPVGRSTPTDVDQAYAERRLRAQPTELPCPAAPPRAPETALTTHARHDAAADLAVRTVPALLEPCTLLSAQLAGIDAWHTAMHEAQTALLTPGSSREQRLDAARRLDVRLREQRALRQHAGSDDDTWRQSLALSGPIRAVVVHRHDWTRQQLRRELAEGGVVLDAGDNGADAVGICVSAQPSLLVVDETLGMRSGAEVLREVRRFCPGTLLAGYVTSQTAVGPLLDAGAHLVATRRVPPRELASRLAELLQTRGA